MLYGMFSYNVCNVKISHIIDYTGWAWGPNIANAGLGNSWRSQGGTWGGQGLGRRRTSVGYSVIDSTLQSSYVLQGN